MLVHLPFKHGGRLFGWYLISDLISHERSIKDIICDINYRLPLDHRNIYILGYPLLMKYKTYINNQIQIHDIAVYSVDDDKVYSHRVDIGDNILPDHAIYGIGLLPRDCKISFPGGHTSSFASYIRNIFSNLTNIQQDVIISYYYNVIDECDYNIELPDIDIDLPDIKQLCDGFGISKRLVTLAD